MLNIHVDPDKFSFVALPEYAQYILDFRLKEFSAAILQFSREIKLPLLLQLKLSEAQLTELALKAHSEILNALASNSVHLHIKQKVFDWVTNNMHVIDKSEIVAEDISLASYIKRKAFNLYISDYTHDQDLQKKLSDEIDILTTQEELVSYSTYNKLQKAQLDKAFETLEFQENLLLEAQAISNIGSFYIDYINPEKSIYMPQTYLITGIAAGQEHTFLNYVHQDDVEKVKELWNSILTEGGSFAYSFRYSKDSVEKKLDTKGIVTIENGQITNIKGTIRDITSYNRLITKLTESEALHKQAQQLTHLGNWSWNIGEDIVSWSDELYRIYGLEPQSEIINFEKFVSFIHPDDRQNRIEEIEEALRTGIANDYVIKIKTAQGDTKILKGYGNVLLDREQKPVKLVGTCQDITKEYHLNDELVNLNRSLYQKNAELQNTNKELESFNYIASHDLQEPLRKIRMFAGRLADQSDNLSEAAKLSLSKVIDSAARMQRLISDLIEFSQISAPNIALEEVPLNDLVDEVLENYVDSIDMGHTIFTVPKLPTISVIPFQFVQLLSNIIGNAVKYKKENLPAHITIESKTVSPEDDPNIKIGCYLRISVRDNGIGFEADQKEKIFELFKRLHSHSKYSGTGIGLAICKKIVHNHHGLIMADSAPGEGSSFHIYLPHKSN